MKKKAHIMNSEKQLQCTARARQAGFTLVELSIVLVIIGLIIGGILKGQELIGNAQIKNVASQAQAYQAAFVAFQDKYDSLPGDLVNANLFLPGCTAASICAPPTAATLGDGIIGATNSDVNDNVSAGVENIAFWQQLVASRLIGDVELITTANTFGTRFPSAATGGGFHALHNSATGRPILRLSGTVAAVSTTIGALRPDQALQIDNILDDGLPNNGAVITNSTLSAVTCFTVATNLYAAANTARSCNLAIDLN
jgi:prepilin-type N-terminal cleavage/methylation domain-containing protein